MSTAKKICVVTGTRAEYGLLSGIIKKIQDDVDLQLQLLVTGSHLSPEFGMTSNEIERDGYHIDEKVEMLLSGDSAVSIVKSLGLGTIGYAEAYDRLKPDMVLLLGDRYEILGASQAAMLMSIPIAHIHGGEITEGAFDDSIRHCISKMAHLHFVTHEKFAKRLQQLGEKAESIVVSGAPGIDNINRTKLFNKEQLSKELDFKLGEMNFLVTFHPETLSDQLSETSVVPLIESLKHFKEAKIVITMANADEGGRAINENLREFTLANSNQVYMCESLGLKRYLSALATFDVVIGNSSSGLLEAPTFKIPTVNIGGRQTGRPIADSVICCENSEHDIQRAIEYALTSEFKTICKGTVNPYGQGNANEVILRRIKNTELDGIIKKQFVDILE